MYKDIQDYCQTTETTLVAVSKTKPISAIRTIYDQGQRIFGENRVEELIEKRSELPDNIEWHFIGTLQTKKVRKLIPHADLIHSVDSQKLLEEINKRSEMADVSTHILLQPKIAKEESKHGLQGEELDNLMNGIASGQYPNIVLRGLMGMATFTDDQSIIKAEFDTLKAYYDQYQQLENLAQFDTLSMGMSGDYKLAIECGSTMVRVGSLIFGSRNYD